MFVIATLLAALGSYSVWSALVLVPAVRHLPRVPRDTLSLVLLGWLVWLPLTLVWSEAAGWALQPLGVLLPLPLAWLAACGLSPAWRQKLLVWLPGGLLVTVLIWGAYQGPNTPTGKPDGPLYDPNTYAALLNLLMLPFLARYLAGKGLASNLALAAVSATLFLIFLVASRGASLALLLVVPVLLWYARGVPDYLRKLGTLLLALVSAYAAAWATSSGTSNVADRLAATASVATGGDPIRMHLFRAAWELIKESPILGHGLGSFRLRYPNLRHPDETISAGGWVHNDYLQLWAEAGLPMLLLVVGLGVWVLVTMTRQLRTQPTSRESVVALGYVMGVVTVLLQAGVNFVLYFPVVGVIVGLYLATLQDRSTVPVIRPRREFKLASLGIGLILGALLVGQAMVDLLLGQSQRLQATLKQIDVYYPRFQIAGWLSYVAPKSLAPRRILATEYLDTFRMMGSSMHGLRDDAYQQLDAAWQAAPCYLPIANDVLLGLVNDPGLSPHPLQPAFIERSLDCDARRSLAYFFAGKVALRESPAKAREWWIAGLHASNRSAQRLMMLTAIESLGSSPNAKEYARLSGLMAISTAQWESTLQLPDDAAMWNRAVTLLSNQLGKPAYEKIIFQPLLPAFESGQI